MDIANLITALAALISAIAAGVSALLYGKKFAETKEAEIQNIRAQIESKEAQIETLQLHIEHLRELTPEKLRESYKSMKEQLVEYIDILSTELDERKLEIEDKDQVISGLREDSNTKATEIDNLRIDRAKIAERAASLESKIYRLEIIQKNLEPGEELKPGIPEDQRNPWWG